jgi:hypothetical protein
LVIFKNWRIQLGMIPRGFLIKIICQKFNFQSYAFKICHSKPSWLENLFCLHSQTSFDNSKVIKLENMGLNPASYKFLILSWDGIFKNSVAPPDGVRIMKTWIKVTLMMTYLI